MSLEIFEKVKDFLIRLVKDEEFRTQLMSDKVEEVRKAIADGGYNFSQEEFEAAAIKILELKELGQFDDLSEDELLGAVGGLTDTTANTSSLKLPWYPYPWPPKGHPSPSPTPPGPQPLYGIVVGPIEPPVQPLYGIVVDPKPPIAQPLYGVIINPDNQA